MDLIKDLEAIEAAAQGNARLEELAKHDSPELRQLLVYATDPSITFGMKQVPEVDSPSGSWVHHNMDSWYKGLVLLLEDLRYRRLTGHAAQEAVSGFLLDCTEDEQKWTERIIKQDLRINLGAKDINKALGEEVVYLFAVALATDYAKIKPKDLKGSWYYQPKADGGRVVALLPALGGPVQLLSRTGKTWECFPTIQAKLQEYNNTRQGRADLYLDGEVVVYVNGKINFQAIQKLFGTDGSVAPSGNLVYFIFDAANEKEWKNPALPYSERLAHATEIAIELNDKKDGYLFRPIPTDLVTDPTPESILRLCQRFVAESFEGVMLRRSDSPVKNKRSKDLLKAKMFDSMESEIVGFVEGNGKIAGMLGTLICKTEMGVEFEVGSGFTEAERVELWAIRDTLPGKWASVKFYEITEAGCPRLPIFQALRHPDDFDVK